MTRGLPDPRILAGPLADAWRRTREGLPLISPLRKGQMDVPWWAPAWRVRRGTGPTRLSGDGAQLPRQPAPCPFRGQRRHQRHVLSPLMATASADCSPAALGWRLPGPKRATSAWRKCASIIDRGPGVLRPRIRRQPGHPQFRRSPGEPNLYAGGRPAGNCSTAPTRP